MELKDLKTLSAQEVFDYVAKHLLTQGKKSESPDGTCMYRNQEGLMCAAGCLMSDLEYRKEMEENSWTMLAAEDVVPVSHSRLIQKLQDIHDLSKVDAWGSDLISLAHEWGLKVNFEV